MPVLACVKKLVDFLILPNIYLHIYIVSTYIHIHTYMHTCMHIDTYTHIHMFGIFMYSSLADQKSFMLNF
jgi:hypothetical protein